MVRILVKKNALKIKEIDLTVVNRRTVSVQDRLSLNGDLKDINEGQGVFWPYKKARLIRSGLCVASGVVSSRLAAVGPGYVTENKLFHPTRVCFVLDYKWCLYSVQVR